MIELNMKEEPKKLGASLKVIGVGGGGGNAVNSMINSGELSEVDFVVANTDAQALDHSPAEYKVQLGAKITKGLGAGSNPDIGRRAAEEDLDSVLENIADSDILFLTAGLGGGTGTGALPVVAKAAREAGILSVAVVTKPFVFEGRRRMQQAEEAIEYLSGVVDTLIVVPNQKLLEVVDPQISMLDAFALSNDILMQGIKGIADIITKPGHINVDFADVRSVMKDMGMAIMGTGRCSGEGRSRDAVVKAISSPLLENVGIEGARGVLINITGNSDLGLHEINEAVSVIYDLVSKDANIILGSVVDPNIGDEIMVTVIATGFEGSQKTKEGNKVMAACVEDDSFDARQPASGFGQPKGSAFHDRRRDDEARIFLKGEDANKSISEPISNDGYSEDRSVAGCAFDMDDVDTPTFLRKKAQDSGEDLSQL